MANREALRELQLRLASRLQAAKTEGASVSSWLAVELAGNPYLVPLAHAGEIFSWPVVQPVPYTQDWFLGVANLRGGLAGVIDLVRFMGDAPYSPVCSVNSSDTRRFSARPSSVSLSAIGSASPKPVAVRRSAGVPFSIR